MGTPEFAVAILERLHRDGIVIKAVVTAPDKPAGRGQKIHASAVKTYAVEHNLPVLQPTNLKDATFTQELEDLGADLFVVVAFRMLPETVWAMPEKGTINLHASLLPQYRGAAPINWAVINGENRTGVSTFFIEKEIDTGKIIQQAEVEIGENETAGELYDRLMVLGAELMSKTVEQIQKGEVNGIEQAAFAHGNLKAAPKIFREDCELDFTRTCQAVHNFCRGLSPYPASWCTLLNEENKELKTFKLFTTVVTELPTRGDRKITSDSEGLLFPCADFYLRVTEIQPEGKRRMHYREFLAGNRIDSFVTKGF